MGRLAALAVIVACRLEFCLKLAEVGQGIGAASRVRCLSVSFGQGLGFLATSLESVSRNQKPQAAGRQGGSGLAGWRPQFCLGWWTLEGGSPSSSAWTSARPQGRARTFFCLCPAQAWPLARESPLNGGAEGPGGCLPTMPTPLGSLLAANSCGERGLPQSGAYRGR